jgi:signal recognition particle subunit SRP54
MADQILGMGDVVSLVEKAQDVVDKEQAVAFQKKARKGSWDLEDFLSQMQQVKKMGSFGDVLNKIPGMSKLIDNGMEIDEDGFKYMEAIIYSMTPKERHNPKILNGSRRRRIAAGSGTSVQEVNRLLKDFEQSKKMVKQMMKGKGAKGKGKMPKGMGPMGPFPGM